MDLKALQIQATKEANKQRAAQANGQQANGTKPRLCTNPLAQLALNGPSKALDEYWRTCLREVNKDKKKEDQKGNPNFLEADWLELRQFIHQAYHADDTKPEPVQKNSRIEKVIKRLCSKDSQQLLLFLESQVQEFVIEVKVGLLELLNKNAPGVQLSRTFLTGLVAAYARLCSGAKCLAPPLKGVEEKHLSMFGMSWEDLNKLLFERCVHADPVMQLKVPQFIGHLHASLPAKDKSSFYGIFQRILALEDEMTNIAAKWKKVESFVHEKNVASLSSMVEELRLDPCSQGARAAAAAAKEQCECRICTSPLLQQLSSMGLTSQNYKEVRERLRKMLDQKAALKSKAVTTSPVATQSKQVQASGKSSSGKVMGSQQQATASPTPSAGSQKSGGKQKGSQQQQHKSKSATNVPNNKHTNTSTKQAPAPVPTPAVPVAPKKPVTSKTPAPFPAHVKQVPPPPPPSVINNNKQPNFVSAKQASCASNGKHPTCCCAEAKLAARKASRHIPSVSSSSSSTQPSTPINDPRDIDALVDFIEGTDRGQARHKDEKKAAKKARQKLKKLQDKQQMEYDDDEEEEEEEEEEVPAPASAVVRVSKNTPSPLPARAQNKGTASKGPPQMVTIRRVMEPSNSEPTVTITLKGDTPEKDTVLFTLVNGQVCKDEEKAQSQQKKDQKPSSNGTSKNQQQQSDGKSKKNKKKTEAKNNNQGKCQAPAPSPAPMKPHVTVTPIPPQPSTAGTILEPMSYLPSGASQPLRPPSSNSLLFTSQGSPGMGAFYAPATPRPMPPPTPVQQVQHHHSGTPSNFTLDSIRLPPGITITKVEAPQHNMQQTSAPSREVHQEMHHYNMPPPPKLPPGVTLANPRMGAMSGAMGMGGMGMPNPNVIVVDTGKLIEDSKNSSHNNQQNQEGKKSCGEKEVPLGQHTMVTMTSAPGNFVTLKRVTEEYPGPAISRSINTFNGEAEAPMLDGNVIAASKKKKNKKKNKGKKVDEWNLVESVFAPKDIDLDAVDDDERELEAFKRFCFNSVPRERKEKVHLNIKDLVIKKKA